MFMDDSKDSLSVIAANIFIVRITISNLSVYGPWKKY